MPAAPLPSNACPTRRVRCSGVVELAGFRLKLIEISASEGSVHAGLLAAARSASEKHLRDHPTRHTHYGVGFLGVHDGEGENQVFLDLWINRNELTHTVWVSPKSDPGRLTRPPEDHNSVCIWDLAAQSLEREAWVRHVLRRAAGPDIEAYLAERIDTRA